MNIPTDFSLIQGNYVVPANIIFGVIINSSESDDSLIKFKITTLPNELCSFINNPMPNYQLTAFSSAYDAETFIKSKLSFEDKFRFHLTETPAILIDRWYVRDTSL